MSIRKKYGDQKRASRKRGIVFLLTFEEWWSIWEESGKFEQRGCRRGQYVMARFGDKGPYAVGNVKIATCDQNTKEAQHNWAAAGIGAKGEKSRSAKLTSKMVAEIRRTYRRGSKDCNTKTLAKKYGVDRTTIGYIVRGQKVGMTEVPSIPPTGVNSWRRYLMDGKFDFFMLGELRELVDDLEHALQPSNVVLHEVVVAELRKQYEAQQRQAS